MTLRRKMGAQIAMMIAGLLLVSATALWGLNALDEDYELAADGYQQLRQVFEVGSHLATAKMLLLPDRPDRARARAEVEVAAARFDWFLSRRQGVEANRRVGLDGPPAAEVSTSLAAAVLQLATAPEQQMGGDVLSADSRAVSAAIGKIGALASAIRKTIQLHQKSARDRRQVTTRAVALVSLAVVLGAALLGILQYRGVMSPLSGLRLGVRKIAGGQFAQRFEPTGGEEFVELANEFNRMASELDAFYHQLEEKVEQKSRELIRSERLASVGYLAAGVAHEINNPLGIISGYAEFSLDRLKAAAANSTAEVDADLARSLQIISDEAFRCKDITGKLLSLARQGDENRSAVCLVDVAEQVVSMVGGLPEYRDRVLTVSAPRASTAPGELAVSAIEAEMKQIVLNLTLNALQASDANAGVVRIDVHRNDGFVELSVSDNGHGMSAATIDRVFEPFFTEKRGSPDSRAARSRGTGLGLSITHAIVVSHGGTISAQSPGTGKGSTFTVRLPAMRECAAPQPTEASP